MRPVSAVVTRPPLGIEPAVRVLPFLAGPSIGLQLTNLVAVVIHYSHQSSSKRKSNIDPLSIDELPRSNTRL
jgi:hypothetical protein